VFFIEPMSLESRCTEIRNRYRMLFCREIHYHRLTISLYTCSCALARHDHLKLKSTALVYVWRPSSV
jgi:hypothetical protein